MFLIGVSLILAAGMSGAQEATNPLDGKRFLSLEKLTGGDRPDGTVTQIHWAVHFKGKSFSWRHHDVIVNGTYEFDAKTGTVKTDDKRITANFDAKTGILTWNKQKYKVAKEGK
jgi:hypothetical protein